MTDSIKYKTRTTILITAIDEYKFDEYLINSDEYLINLMG